MVNRVSGSNRRKAEVLAVQALSFIAADPERLGRFLALSGIGPSEVRAASHEPGFLAGVLDYVASDEGLLKAFAQKAGLSAREVGAALIALGGLPWERDAP
jgi:hypothetical protein